MSEKRLKILYLLQFPFYGSGSGTYARYLGKEVGKHHDVMAVYPDNRRIKYVTPYKLKLPFKAAFTGHPEWKNAKLFKEISNKELVQIYKDFLDSCIEAVEIFQPNIIHVHHAFPLSWVARFIKSIYNIPYIITVHGSELPTAEEDNRYIALTTDALRRARKIVPNSNYTKEWMLNIFRDTYHGQIKVIPGGVDVHKFKATDYTSIDEEYGLKGKKVALFAGKLTPYKGVEYLVRAADKINGEVVILGQGSEMPKLQKIKKENNLKNVHFIGHLGNDVKKLIQFYTRADVLVAPSIWDEPLGLVILEAMSCKTPVVVTKKGGIPLAVKDGVNGLFIKSKNCTDLIEKVNFVLNNKKERMRMAENARKIAEEKFAWELIANQFIKIYKQYAKS